MTFLKTLALGLALALPASAGLACAKNECTRGELVDFIKTDAQEKADGAANGFGKVIADRAQNGSVSGARNFGQFLRENAKAPGGE